VNGKVFYQAAKVHPTQRELYSVNLKGKNETEISKEPGWNDAQFSSTFDYYVNTYSAAGVAPSYTVYDRNQNVIRVIEDNKTMAVVQQKNKTQPVDFFDFNTSEDVQLHGFMIKPNNFDPNKKYPVLMYVYGGPGSQTVKDQWGSQNYWWFQMMAQKGYLVVSVDNRGTGARGEEFKKMTYLQLSNRGGQMAGKAILCRRRSHWYFWMELWGLYVFPLFVQRSRRIQDCHCSSTGDQLEVV